MLFSNEKQVHYNLSAKDLNGGFNSKFNMHQFKVSVCK